MGTIYQRYSGGPYYGYWTDTRGRHQRKSLRTRDAKVAAARLRELELAATNPATYQAQPLDVAIANMLAVLEQERAAGTVDSYRKKARHLIRVLGNIDLRDLDRSVVVRYNTHRKGEGAGSGTRHKELVVLRKVLHEAGERGLWHGDVRKVVPSIKVDYAPRERWIETEHQIWQLIGQLAPRRRPWAMLAIWGGLCRGEVERLEWPMVDLANGVLTVPGTKRASRRRTIPIAPELATALASVRGTRRAGKVVERWQNAIRDLQLAAVAAKLPDAIRKLTPNDLRRTFASLMLNRGVSALVVAKLLGHGSTKMVERVYGRITAKTYREAIAQLPVSTACATGEKTSRAFVATGETNDAGCFGTCDGKPPKSFL